MSAQALPQRHYYAECPDSGIRTQVTMTATETGQTLPPVVDMPCISCDYLHPHLPMGCDRVEALMADEDRELTSPDIYRSRKPRPVEMVRTPDRAAPDTSQPYFLDLVHRIDEEIGA